MQNVYEILVGIAALMLLGLGVLSMFAPKRMIKNFSIEPTGPAGLSTIRSVIGGLFLSCVTFMTVGLVTGQTTAFLAVAILLAVVAFGRIVSIIADGFNKHSIPPLIVEIVMVAILMMAYCQGPFSNVS